MNKRDGINEVLLALNELPLEVEDSISDISIATIVDKQLEIARKSILARGWFFNKYEIELYPNTVNKIVVPQSYLSIDGGENSPNITIRDWKLFDKEELSFIFTEPVKCIVIEDIPFDDIPFLTVDFIIKTATIQAYINIIGNSDDVNIRMEMLRQARISASNENARNLDLIITNDTFTSDLIDRTSI